MNVEDESWHASNCQCASGIHFSGECNCPLFCWIDDDELMAELVRRGLVTIRDA